MTKETISSSSNPLLKRYRKLKASAKRSPEGATVVEGIAPVWQAVENAEIETMLVSRDLLQSEAARKLVDRARASGTEIVDLTTEAFGSIADRDNPTGLAAIVSTPDRSMGDLSVAPDSLFVVLADVASPGNLGTIVRTADAASAAVIVTGESTDPWHPAAVKASMGTAFSTPVVSGATLEEALAWTRSRQLRVVTTSARAKTEHWEAQLRTPTAIVLGSERHGLPQEVIEQGDVQVRIPMLGSASSLNLAIAAGILLYEARRPIR